MLEELKDTYTKEEIKEAYDKTIKLMYDTYDTLNDEEAKEFVRQQMFVIDAFLNIITTRQK